MKLLHLTLALNFIIPASINAQTKVIEKSNTNIETACSDIKTSIDRWRQKHNILNIKTNYSTKMVRFIFYGSHESALSDAAHIVAKKCNLPIFTLNCSTLIDIAENYGGLFNNFINTIKEAKDPIILLIENIHLLDHLKYPHGIVCAWLNELEKKQVIIIATAYKTQFITDKIKGRMGYFMYFDPSDPELNKTYIKSQLTRTLIPSFKESLLRYGCTVCDDYFTDYIKPHFEPLKSSFLELDSLIKTIDKENLDQKRIEDILSLFNKIAIEYEKIKKSFSQDILLTLPKDINHDALMKSYTDVIFALDSYLGQVQGYLLRYVLAFNS